MRKLGEECKAIDEAFIVKVKNFMDLYNEIKAADEYSNELSNRLEEFEESRLSDSDDVSESKKLAYFEVLNDARDILEDKFSL